MNMLNVLAAVLNDEGYSSRLADLGGELIIWPRQGSKRRPALGIVVDGVEATLLVSYGSTQTAKLTVDLNDPQSINKLITAIRACE
jgi:hypothetical protein